MAAATYYSHRDSEPTNSRPWPHTRVTITATGDRGTVGDYEYWWPTGTTFPVQLDRTPGLHRNYTTSQISVASNPDTSTDSATATNDNAHLDLVQIPAQRSAGTPRSTPTRTEPIPETTA
jgi:hypothetical protein